MEEKWLPVQGYEELYEISDLGRIKSIKRMGARDKILSLHMDRGYLRVTLCRNGRSSINRIHRLVYEAFVGPTDIIDHIDGNRSNNRLSNLRSCNHLGNHANQIKRVGTSSKFKGVTFRKDINKWCSRIKINNKNISLGVFCLEEDAARAYDVKAVELFGEFAKTNKDLGLL